MSGPIPKKQLWSGGCAAVCLMLGAVPALSAEWQKSAFVSGRVLWTDNFCLSRDDKESEFVETLTPGVSVRGRGARASMSLNGSVEFNTAGESDIVCNRAGGTGQALNLTNRESVIPSGRFNGSVEAIENWLTFQANAFAGLNPVNPFAPGSDDAVNGRGNDNVTYRWGVGATLNREFEQKVGVLLSYNYNEQYNSFNRLFGDSSENRVRANIGMLPGTSRLRLSARGRYSEVEFEENFGNPEFTNTLASAELRAVFAINDSWQLNALAGEEFNEFLRVSDEIEGDYWDVGVRWAPNNRVAVAAGTGERFFGETPRASITYRHKRSRLRLNYERSLNFPRNLRAPEVDDVNDPLGPGFDDLPGDPLDADGNPVLFGGSPILIESFSLNYLFSARRTRFIVTARDSQQERTADGATGEFRNASIGATRTLGRNLSLNARLSWRESEGSGSDIDLFGRRVEAWSAQFGVRRGIARNTSLSFSYRFTDQTSDFTLNEFEENRLTLSLRHNFR